VFTQLADAVINGDVARTGSLSGQALAAGMPAGEVLENGLIAGMKTVGERFRDYEMFIPEVLRSVAAMREGLRVLKPELVGSGTPPRGKVVIGTVEGDIHDVGKSLVIAFLEGAGFEVIDLGVAVPVPRFIEAVQEEAPDLLGLSSLLTSTLPAMRRTIEGLTEAGIRNKVRVLIGGAPVTQAFADSIGADGYGSDGASGAAKALQLVGR